MGIGAVALGYLDLRGSVDADTLQFGVNDLIFREIRGLDTVRGAVGDLLRSSPFAGYFENLPRGTTGCLGSEDELAAVEGDLRVGGSKHSRREQKGLSLRGACGVQGHTNQPAAARKPLRGITCTNLGGLNERQGRRFLEWCGHTDGG